VREQGEPDLQDLWTEYKSTGDERAREGLILHYSPLVKFVAGRVGSGLPRNVDQNDLVSFGTPSVVSSSKRMQSIGSKARSSTN